MMQRLISKLRLFRFSNLKDAPKNTPLSSDPANKDYQNVTVNIEGIKKRLLERETKLPLSSPAPTSSADFYNPKTNPRPTEYIFDFFEPQLADKDQYLQVYGLQNGFFSVNNTWYPGSLILFPRQLFLWDVQTAADIRPHSFDILDCIKPLPTFILVGTGKDKVELPDSLFERFYQRGIRVDVVPTFEACSHFNFCSEEARNVCAFLIPSNL